MMNDLSKLDVAFDSNVVKMEDMKCSTKCFN